MTTQTPLIFRGREAGPTVLLLHGFLGHPDDWTKTWQAGPDKGTWIMPWLPGHGSQPAAVDLLQFREQLCRVLAEHPSIDLCVGYSLGGRVALAMQRWPALWSKLLLVSCSTAAINNPIERFAQDIQKAHDLSVIGLSSFIHSWYSQPLFADMEHDSAFLERRLIHHAQSVAEVLWRWSPARLRLHPLNNLAGMIFGGLDPIYAPMAQRASATNTYCIEQASHHIPQMAPQQLRAIIDRCCE